MKSGQGKVPCPFCGFSKTRTLVTQKTRRRRECILCARRFTTYERYADHIFKEPEQYQAEKSDVSSI